MKQQGSVLGSGPEELGGRINLLGILTKDHNGRGVPGRKIGKGPIRQDGAVPVSRPKCKAGAWGGGRHRHRARRRGCTRWRGSSGSWHRGRARGNLRGSFRLRSRQGSGLSLSLRGRGSNAGGTRDSLQQGTQACRKAIGLASRQKAHKRLKKRKDLSLNTLLHLLLLQLLAPGGPGCTRARVACFTNPTTSITEQAGQASEQMQR